MTYCIGIVHKDEGSSYGIAFPDLPGCFSVGEDIEKFPASDMTAIRTGLDADDRDAMLMAVPFVRSGGRTVRVNFTVDAGTLDAIDAAAKRRKLSRSAFLVSAAHNEITGAH